jgi:anti-sigma B factor antagonist
MIPFAFAKLFEGSNLEIQQRERDGVLIIDLEEHMVMGEEELALRQRASSLLDEGKRNLILNLKGVTEIDILGIGALEFFAGKFQEAGGKCILLNLDPASVEPADLLKLSTIFNTYQDEVDAVNSFFPDRVVPRYDILEFVETLDQRRDSTEESGASRS